MAENDDNKPLGNDGTPPAPAPKDGNTDWKAKYEELNKEHTTVVQQRNMYRNKATELETKVTDAEKKNSELQGEFDRLRGEKEQSEKSIAIEKKRDEILKNYPEEVQKKAKELGIDLTDPEDKEAIDGFTKKLDVLKGTEEPAKGDDGKPPAPKVGSDNIPKEGDKVEKTEEEIIAEEDERLKDIKF